MSRIWEDKTGIYNERGFVKLEEAEFVSDGVTYYVSEGMFNSALGAKIAQILYYPYMGGSGPMIEVYYKYKKNGKWTDDYEHDAWIVDKMITKLGPITLEDHLVDYFGRINESQK